MAVCAISNTFFRFCSVLSSHNRFCIRKIAIFLRENRSSFTHFGRRRRRPIAPARVPVAARRFWRPRAAPPSRVVRVPPAGPPAVSSQGVRASRSLQSFRRLPGPRANRVKWPCPVSARRRARPHNNRRRKTPSDARDVFFFFWCNFFFQIFLPFSSASHYTPRPGNFRTRTNVRLVHTDVTTNVYVPLRIQLELKSRRIYHENNIVISP